MGATSGKLAGGLLLLIGVWIGVYWVWEPSRPPITLDRTGEEAAPPLMNVQREPPGKTEATNPVERPVARVSGVENGNAVTPPDHFDYIVKPGDTFESISTEFWQSPKYASIITRLNPLADAGRLLTPGRTIRLARDPNNWQGVPVAPQANVAVMPVPPKPTDVAKVDPPKQQTSAKVTATQEPAKAVGKGRTYTVQDGDSLSKIAKRFYDSASQWEKIYEANKGSMKGPHDLKVGAVLVIPD